MGLKNLQERLEKLECLSARHGGGNRPAFGSDAESIVSLCQRGEAQGIVVMPQASLVSEFQEEEMGVQYSNWAAKDNASRMYDVFVEALTTTARELVVGPKGRLPVVVHSSFYGRQALENASDGPFMHS